MAESKSKTEDTAAKASTAAPKAAAKPVMKSRVKAAVKTTAPVPAKLAAKPAAPIKKAPKAKPAPVAAKPEAPVTMASVAEPAPAAAKPEAEPTQPSVTALKEKIMATTATDYSTDFGATMADTMTQAVSELQSRTQAAYDKSTEGLAEMTDFAKGNVEALVESGTIMAAAMQDMGKSYADEAKSAYETVTADLKEMAAVKSPTELFQLQGKIMRRNFDMLVAATSKSTDVAMKLANDVAAPLSGRVNLAAEKMSKVA